MSRARPYLLCVLTLTLASCASFKPAPPSYAPPRIDCAISDPPAKPVPSEPAPTEKSVVVWQLYAFALQQFAAEVLGQRYESAVCVKDLRDKGIVR